MKVVIATPFYEVKAYSPYVVSLIQSISALVKLGIEWEYYEVSGDSYVDRAKNSLVHRFLEGDATHLLMVDSDMYWDINGFMRMIRAAIEGFEIVAAAYPCKNNWDFFGCHPKFDPETKFLLGKEVNGIRVLDMDVVPGGFILYSREAFERARPNLRTYYDPKNDITILEAFRCNVENDIRIGEDVYFQQRYKEAGGIVWLEPDITIRHIGVRAWEGNYNHYLLTGEMSTEVDPRTFQGGNK